MALGGQLIQEPDAIHHPNPLLDQPPQDSSTVEPLDFSALRLESSPPATISLHHHSPCANCGFCGSGNGAGADHSNSSSGSHKRPLPSSTSTSASLLFPQYDPQPKPKKLFLEPNDAVVVSAADPPALPAPVEHSGHNPFFLRRCVSDPYHAPLAPAYQSPPDSFPGSGSGSGSGIFSNNFRSPENVVKTNTTTSSVTPCSVQLPPRPPPTLRRCDSDPNPSPGKSFSRTSSSTDLEKTPNSKKLGKMWQCWKEMNSKMEEVMSEEQAEENDNEENNEANTSTEQLKDVIDKGNKVSLEDSCLECEESLSLERTGEGLTIRFHCNCGRGYEFLFHGGNYYYKLL